MDYLKNFNVYNNVISIAVGKSCSLDMLFHIYDLSRITDNLRKNIILESCKRGSNIFIDYYNSLISIDDFNDIILAICESSNLDMIIKYKNFISNKLLNDYIIKTIEINNIIMFIYLWNNYEFKNFYDLIIITCKFNRNNMLNIILNSKTFDLKFYISIFNECTLYSNINIIEKILSCIGELVDINLTFIQLCKLERGIINILNSKNNLKIEWLKNNISINPIINILKGSRINKKREIMHRYGEDEYISSDDENN